VANLTIPYRYYVPHRVREAQKGKLVAAGLWDLPEEKVESEPKTFAERQVKARQTLADHNFSQTFAKQKVCLT
jgi:sorting and assembly machinery component 37